MNTPLTVTSPISLCAYLPDQRRRLRYEFNPSITADGYMDRLREGWRRFGPFLFRPECPTCRMCQSLRVPTATFRPDESQRRAWRKNIDELTVGIGTPSLSPEKVDLIARFHEHGHQTKGWPPGDEQDPDLFVVNPFPIEEWTYHLSGRLVGIGYVDALSEGLSAIYFVHDPDERRRSLGTFNVLALIAAARERGLPFVYLGYYVKGCRSLEYKARFRPYEILQAAGQWALPAESR